MVSSARGSLPESAEVVVVGAGFAGLATARELMRRGVGVVVLEAEAIPGFHASGRNAAIARSLVGEASVAALARRGVALLEALSREGEDPIFRASGGLLLGRAPQLAQLMEVARAAGGYDTRPVTRAEAEAMVPALRGSAFDGGIHVAGDGVVDIHALLSQLLREVRARTFFNTPVVRIEVVSNQVRAVRTPRGRIATERVVNAAGFSVNAVAALAGLGPLRFSPVRRHLFVTAPTTLVARGGPWVWDIGAGWYFRPEGAGLLMCACDATPWPDDRPEVFPADPPVDAGAREVLAEKFHRAVPGLRDTRPARGWAGLRILTPDDRFVIGADRRLDGFSWVAGLGGHGMTTSCAVGELGARAALGEPLPAPFGEAFDPGRPAVLHAPYRSRQ